MNPNWVRWICASVADSFNTVLSANNLPVYLEGAPRNTDNLKDFCEIRFNGPFFDAGSQGEWVMQQFEVNIFIQSKEDQKDLYRIDKNIGFVLAAFLTQIPVYKLGDTPVIDDQSLITCIKLKTGGRELLKVLRFGQVSPTTQLLRAAVEGDYFGNFNDP